MFRSYLSFDVIRVSMLSEFRCYLRFDHLSFEIIFAAAAACYFKNSLKNPRQEKKTFPATSIFFMASLFFHSGLNLIVQDFNSFYKLALRRQLINY